MAPLLKLFTKPGTRCQIIEWLALELNAAITLESNFDPRSPSYRTIHPFGKLPAAIGACGTPIFESGAILLYLADSAGATPTPALRARAAKWVVWANASYWPAAEAGRRTPPAILSGLEAILSTQPFIDGATFTVSDVAVASYLHYCAAFFGDKFAGAPAVARYVATIRERAAFKATIGAE